ncbi:hypothetical protein CR970_01590 [Candidatus Saccharibacteria bacterium]|nr:MAG: hypothetical protein CR970_01590 [Candidatus Saccharibacteria bacterium]
MQAGFRRLYQSLNDAQKQAVDTIDGPLLVLAGPGTGKTQLLSARVANILQKTDTLPQNVLCLTFTENGARNMRDRLSRFIGQDAYHVAINTYHGFGSDIINRYPEYFVATRLENPIDQLGKHQILNKLIEQLDYDNPLKQLQHHIGDLIGAISETKRALLSADDLRAIAAHNLESIADTNQRLASSLQQLSALSRMSAKALPIFQDMLDELTKQTTPPKTPKQDLLPIQKMLGAELEEAVAPAEADATSKPLTAWKNKWLAKDANNQYVVAGELENKRIMALSQIVQQYQDALEQQHLYDFDDMILRTIQALETNPELKYSLQEQYLYILLDEFQDTNAAQLRIVQLLSDNPVHEGRPNIMAVGDDDQAIYAFQGAEVSNMLSFYTMYHGTTLINLTENYRSGAPILEIAQTIGNQIESRLSSSLPKVSKQLRPANPPASPEVTYHSLTTAVAQYDWIAESIQQHLKKGTPAREIAVLAPKHKYLEPLVAHLNQRGIPVQYEKREDVLHSEPIVQLLTMSRLILALTSGEDRAADGLWPSVLSYPFWGIPVQTIWEVSWRVREQQHQLPHTTWLHVLMDDQKCRDTALFFASAALLAPAAPAEAMLDHLLGTEPLSTNDPDNPTVASPFRAFYTSPELQATRPDTFYHTITELRVFQEKLRDYQAASNKTLLLQDVVAYADMYEQSGEILLNTSPYHQGSDAVQLMTVYKSKGLEFEHVYLPSLHEDVWGGGSLARSNRLTLPKNLQHIRHAGASDDERLRLLYVAATRAKAGLHLSSFSHSFSGKETRLLSYLSPIQQSDGSHILEALPAAFRQTTSDDRRTPTLQALENDWRSRHCDSLDDPDLRAIIEPRLARYQLSPTHLNLFTDLVYGGPREFLLRTILRFPSAPSPSGQYGNAVHAALDWAQRETKRSGQRPATAAVLKHFREYMTNQKMAKNDQQQLTKRGEQALSAWLAERGPILGTSAVSEHDFKNEGVFVGDAHLSGKVDFMEIDQKNKRITVVDYKTGHPRKRWIGNDINLHKYRRQLYCYKLLIEGSHTFQGYRVEQGRLEFIEPDADGTIYALPLTFDDKELENTKRLIRAIWQRIQSLALPATEGYRADIQGVIAFENDLIDEL